MMNKDKVKEIIKFSFFKYFKNKWFVIFNILSLVSIIVSLNWKFFGSIIPVPDKEKNYQISVLDTYNIFSNNFYKEFEEKKDITIDRINDNTYTKENIPDDFIIVEAYPDDEQMLKIKLISKEGIKNNVYDYLMEKIKTVRNKMLEQKYNLSDDTLDILQNDVSVERIMLAVDAENSEFKSLVNLFASALTYLVSVIVFTRIASEISQEKSTKASEYVLTAVSEKEYLYAKVFSNIAILIIQLLLMFSYYLISAGILSLTKTAVTEITLSSALSTSGLSTDMVLYILALIFYNIITLILMCIIQATIASKTTSASEAGNSTSILIFLMMVMYIMTNVLIDPYSKANLALYIFSTLPIVSSFLVPAMIVIGQATWWQIVISLLLMILIIPKVFNYCAKVFKNGLLDYKKKKKSIFDIEPDNTLETLMNKREFSSLGSVVGIAILIYVGVQTFVSAIASLVLTTVFENVLSSTEMFLILQMIGQISALGLAYLFVKAYHSKNPGKKQKIKLKKSHIIIVTLSGIILLQILLNFIYPFFGLDYSVTNLIEINENSSVFAKILLIVVIAVTPAVFEELFFRKGLINLCEVHGKKFALLFSALIFGMAHMNLSQALFAFIIGLMLGAIYIYTKDIKIPMLIHFLNNGTEALSIIIPKGGTSEILLNFAIITILIFGITSLIVNLFNKEFIEDSKRIIKKGVSFNNFCKKQIYMFFDFIFDVSLLMLIVLTIMQERIYRSL